MTSSDRLAEVAEILAAGFLRLRQRHGKARQSSSLVSGVGETPPDCTASKSGHANRGYVLDQCLAAGMRHD